MKREVVEALLAACERDRIGPHPDNETLAALCRRWLAVEDAPSVEITACNQIEGARDFDYGDMVAASQKFDAGQYVRIVPEAGRGGG